MNKEQLEESVRTAIRPAEGNVNTIVEALTGTLPFAWDWVADGIRGTIQIQSEPVNIQINGKNAVFNWNI